MIRITRHLAATLLPILCLPLQAGEEAVWHTDFAAAEKKAAKENKDLLIHFAGSDWCGWSMKLGKEVFHQAAFSEKASKEYILVRLDFPRRKALAPELVQQNAVLKKKYNVTSHPTVILCDPAGRPYARIGYKAGGPEKYLTHLEKLKTRKAERDTAFALAEGLEGKEKARALEKALASVPRTSLSYYEQEIATVHAADPDDVSGFYNRYLIQKTALELRRIAMPLTIKGKHQELIQEVEKYILEHKLEGEALQTAMLFKLTSHYLSKNQAATLKCADEIIAINDINTPGRYAAMFKKRIKNRSIKK
mgnify:CR=1 FL=1